MRIKLDTLLNTRDLCTITNKDGYAIKPHKIIRSGALCNASVDDIHTLVNDYALSTIIDLRTQEEIEEKPDPSIDFISHVHVPLFESFVAGITREEEEEKYTPKDELEFIVQMIQEMNNDTFNDMILFYPKLVNEEFSIHHFQKFFHIFLSQPEGSILYHCSAGKDRVGTATALLLSALDVDQKTILDDYLYTNICYQDRISFLENEARKRGIAEDTVQQIKYCEGVQPEFIQSTFNSIESQYGSIHAYLKQVLLLNDEDLAKLKRMYLQK